MTATTNEPGDRPSSPVIQLVRAEENSLELQWSQLIIALRLLKNGEDYRDAIAEFGSDIRTLKSIVARSDNKGGNPGDGPGDIIAGLDHIRAVEACINTLGSHLSEIRAGLKLLDNAKDYAEVLAKLETDLKMLKGINPVADTSAG